MSVSVCSCEKENGVDVNPNDIEGRWYKAVKWEKLLNNQVVLSSTNFDEADYPLRRVSKVMFQNGNVNVIETDGDSTVWPYVYSNGIITIFGEEFIVVKANKKELIGDSSFGDFGECNEQYKEKLTTFKGVDIYYDYEYDSDYKDWVLRGFYYFNKQGKPMYCTYKSKSYNPFQSEVVYHEGLKRYVDKITSVEVDYWYDTDRIYLTAE